MIDIKSLRENPQRYIDGAAEKNIPVDITTLLDLDEQRRLFTRQRENHRAEQKRISKEIGPQIGKLKSQLKNANEEQALDIESQLVELEAKPIALKIIDLIIFIVFIFLNQNPLLLMPIEWVQTPRQQQSLIFLSF